MGLNFLAAQQKHRNLVFFMTGADPAIGFENADAANPSFLDPDENLYKEALDCSDGISIEALSLSRFLFHQGPLA